MRAPSGVEPISSICTEARGTKPSGKAGVVGGGGRSSELERQEQRGKTPLSWVNAVLVLIYQPLPQKLCQPYTALPSLLMYSQGYGTQSPKQGAEQLSADTSDELQIPAGGEGTCPASAPR